MSFVLRVVAAVSLVVLVSAQDRASLLKEERRNLVFMPYSPEQRQEVARNIENIFEIYVHTDSKVQNYAREYPQIDPRPRIAEISRQAANMTDEDFHFGILDIFNSLRDFHTQYSLPGPYNCYLAVSGLNFQIFEPVRPGEDAPIIVTGSIASRVNLPPASAALKRVKPGDELVSVNGLSFKEYAEKNKYVFGGATKDAAIRAALFSLTVIPGRSHRLPEEDDITFGFKSSRDGEEYSVTTPWVAIRRGDCFSQVSKVWRNPSKFAPVFTTTLKNPYEYDMDKQFTLKEQLNLGRNPFSITPMKFIPSGVELQSTPEDTIRYGIYEHNDQKMGVISLKSFVPSNPNQAFRIIATLLTTSLKNTDYLLFDVRDNPGGYLTYANLLPQLFVPQIRIGSGRAVVSELNKVLFTKLQEFTWVAALDNATSRYTESVYFDKPEAMSTFGGVYLKPVGVFTNAKCYSSCDLFSANMQDSAAAIIFGEDETTGAGGANVLEYTGLLDKLYPEAFTSFPYQNKLEKESAQTMTLAWRQMIRNGGTEKYVEDIGIKSSHVFKPTIEDFFGKSNTQSQLSRIAEILHIQGQITGRRDMYFSATPTGLEDVNINGKSEFGIEVSGLDKISLKDGSGVEIGHTPASRTRLNQKEKLTLEPKEPASKIGMFRYEIQASRADQLYLKTYRTIRVIPSLEDRYHIAKNESFVWDFTIGNGTAVYNNFGLPDRDGWHIDEKNKLRLGDGQSYAPRVQSIISWFFTVAPDVRRMAFHITASYDTEEKADFFNCGYKDKKDKVHWIYDSGLSGSGMYNHHLDVWNVGTGFEAFCLFTSDDFLSGRGVAVSSIQMIPSKWIF